MDPSSMVPERVPELGSDRSVAPSGADPQSHLGSSPLSSLPHAIYEVSGLDLFMAAFADQHPECNWVLCCHEGTPVYHAWCPECAEGKLYRPEKQAEVASLLSDGRG